MNMLASVEARWFMAGEPSEEIEQWFKKGAVSPDTIPRVDHYLSLPGVPSIGVKLREGNFEVKRRDINFGLANLGPGVTGRIAFWRKWSFTLRSSDERRPDGHWISVEKLRCLRKYSIDDLGVLAAVHPKCFPERGCTVELTTLKVHDSAWWSFGFEAFGHDETELRSTLELVAATCLDINCPVLQVEDSFDYPEWLALFGHLV